MLDAHDLVRVHLAGALGQTADDVVHPAGLRLAPAAGRVTAAGGGGSVTAAHGGSQRGEGDPEPRWVPPDALWVKEANTQE